MASSNASIVVNRFIWLFLQHSSERGPSECLKFPSQDLRPAVKTIGFRPLLPPIAPSFGISERSGCRVKGLTLTSCDDVYVHGAYSRASHRREMVFRPHDEEDQGTHQT